MYSEYPYNEKEIFPLSIEETYMSILNDDDYYIDWENLPRYYYLSCEFIKEFKDKLDWDLISIEQSLTEENIIEFENYVNWELIFLYQEITENFINQYKYKIDFKKLSDIVIVNIEDNVLSRYNYLFNILR